MNPYGPEIQSPFCYLSRAKRAEFGKKEVFTNPLPTAMFPVLLPPILRIPATGNARRELFNLKNPVKSCNSEIASVRHPVRNSITGEIPVEHGFL